MRPAVLDLKRKGLIRHCFSFVDIGSGRAWRGYLQWCCTPHQGGLSLWASSQYTTSPVLRTCAIRARMASTVAFHCGARPGGHGPARSGRGWSQVGYAGKEAAERHVALQGTEPMLDRVQCSSWAGNSRKSLTRLGRSRRSGKGGSNLPASFRRVPPATTAGGSKGPTGSGATGSSTPNAFIPRTTVGNPGERRFSIQCRSGWGGRFTLAFMPASLG